MKELSKKELVYFKICDSVLHFEVIKGHLKWSLSDISKHSGVTRSLIYYYMGKEKDQILHEAVLYMLELFFNTKGDNKLGVHERMKQVLIKAREMPHLYLYYVSERLKDSEYGHIIRDAEGKLMKYLQETLGLGEMDVLRLFMLELGAVAFQLDPDQAYDFFSFMPVEEKSNT